MLRQEEKEMKEVNNQYEIANFAYEKDVAARTKSGDTKKTAQRSIKVLQFLFLPLDNSCESWTVQLPSVITYLSVNHGVASQPLDLLFGTVQ